MARWIFCMPENLGFELLQLAVGLAPLEPERAGEDDIRQKAERPDRLLDHGERARFQHKLQGGGIFIIHDGDQRRTQVALGAQELADLIARVKIDRQHKNVGLRRRTIRNRPTGVDHASDAFEVLDEILALLIRGVDNLHTEVAEITKNAAYHGRSHRRSTPRRRERVGRPVI